MAAFSFGAYNRATHLDIGANMPKGNTWKPLPTLSLSQQVVRTEHKVIIATASIIGVTFIAPCTYGLFVCKAWWQVVLLVMAICAVSVVLTLAAVNDWKIVEGKRFNPSLVRGLIESLPARLGFDEITADLTGLRNDWLSALRSGGETRATASAYIEAAQEYIDQYSPTERRMKLQVGLIIQTALIRRQGGDLAGYKRDIADALVYAENIGLSAAILLQEELESLEQTQS